jgi:hypothetical protein
MKYSWTQKPILRWFSCWHGTPYWHFYDPIDWEEYEMTLSLKKFHPIRYKWFILLCIIDEKVTKLIDKKNVINNDIPF